MSKKTTKEDLIIKIAQLENNLKIRNEEDERIRKEFAKIFDWEVTRSSYSNYHSSVEFETPSWEKVFTKVGRLLENSYTQLRISNVEESLENVKKLWFESEMIRRGEDIC